MDDLRSPSVGGVPQVPAPLCVFEIFRCVKDTGRVVHVWLWRVEIWMCAEQFRNER